jgi:hypothetical protein
VVGGESVDYVSNIYKYYVAYRIAVMSSMERTITPGSVYQRIPRQPRLMGERLASAGGGLVPGLRLDIQDEHLAVRIREVPQMSLCSTLVFFGRFWYLTLPDPRE